MAKKRTDAEWRLWQCERLSRLLRILSLIQGAGRWDADTLARELECSRRTVYRDLQTLSMAGVPWYYDNTAQAYRVRPGFRFPALDKSSSRAAEAPAVATAEVRAAAEQLVKDGERLLESLRRFTDMVAPP